MVRVVWVLGLLAASAAYSVRAQDVEAELLALEDERPELEDDQEFGPPEAVPSRPWTLAAWAPANWRSNRRLVSNTVENGVALEPELTLARRWGEGKLVFFGEAGMFQSAMLPDARLDMSGWWITAELGVGNPREQWSPYLSYEPRGHYAGTFGAHLMTFQDLTLGVRRNGGPWALNAFVRRRESDGRVGDRMQFAAHGQFTQPLGEGVRLNLRGDAEYRTFEDHYVEDGESQRRRDIRARLRTRLFVALDPAVDLVLTADVQRHWSTVDRFRITNVVIGPALSARFGF
ncbi:hypothetical protein [Sandaracinobacteroides hominis]|uniref:hypothetical protein n=1 Tax=Sandaracinobacteroides hominis TaxID=2780086 RepID=UPI0018F55D83|nr:hypothetical protein [Sandaracinobacteroides hominis]